MLRAEEVIVLPVRVHLIQGATMNVKETKLDLWVKAEQVKQVLLPEVNRIWKPADVRFEIESIIEEVIPESPLRAKVLAQIAAFKRDAVGVAPFELTKRLFDPEKFHPSAINIYLFPYVGETLQGVATLGGNRVLVGVWSDKSSGGKKPPQKTLLTEPEPMVIGSLARTMGHELGHALTLEHPAKSAEPKGRQMGGGKQGYLLTPEEIAQARESARKHLLPSAQR